MSTKLDTNQTSMAEFLRDLIQNCSNKDQLDSYSNGMFLRKNV